MNPENTENKLSERRCYGSPILVFAALLSLALVPAIYLRRHGVHDAPVKLLDHFFFQTQDRTTTAGPTTLKFVALSFNLTAELPMIDHNCAILSSSGHQYEIHTDNISHPFCRKCDCHLFKPTGCKCPNPAHHGCSLCEKLVFVQRMLAVNKEFAFLDSDLVVLRPDFADALLSRTIHFDFLASYGFGNPCGLRYSSMFNSGLMFIRQLPGLDYTELQATMNRTGRNNDQNIISPFVQKRYTRWDSLSLRWHCRYLFRSENDIDPRQCFTFHGRGRELERVLRRLNRTLLRTADLLS